MSTYRENTVIFKPRRQDSEDINPADTMMADVQPLEL
jgi:hypothetical protein